MEKQKKSGVFGKHRKSMGFPKKYLGFMENPGKFGFPPDIFSDHIHIFSWLHVYAVQFLDLGLIFFIFFIFLRI